MRTTNPVLNQKTFSAVRASTGAEVMTLQGAVNKTLLSIVITMIAGYWAWGDPTFAKLYIPFIIGGFILSLIISFKRTWAPALTPVYAAMEGFAMGSFSRFVDTIYPGVAFDAISLTFGTLLCLLMAYKSGWIKPSQNFKLGLMAATGGICVIYLLSLLLSLFGVHMTFLYDASPLSIVLSLVIVAVAALNLVLDFDFIENAAARGDAPKYMEWVAAFGLLVTLVWLYVEIVRLLMKLRSRD